MDPDGLIEQLRGALRNASADERGRLLGSLFFGGGDGQGICAPDAELAARMRQSRERCAQLELELAGQRADLGDRTKEIEALKQYGEKREEVLNHQRDRVTSLETELATAHGESEKKEAEIRALTRANEDLTLRVQRLELATQDHGTIERLETEKVELLKTIEGLRTEQERYRAEREASGEELKQQAAEAAVEARAGGTTALAKIWERLAAAKPPLAKPVADVTPQAAERLADTLAALTQFVHNFDQGLRPFPRNYTKPHPGLKTPWNVYDQGEDIDKTVARIIDAAAGTPVGTLRLRLRRLNDWGINTLIALDSTLASTEFELESFLSGPMGTGEDPNRRIKDFVKDNGPGYFMERMWTVLREKLAETFKTRPNR